jgi:hypothetical protein
VESDPILRAVERNVLVIATAMTAAALLLGPRPQLAVGVAAGALLVGFSYWTLKRSVGALTAMLIKTPESGAKLQVNPARELLKLVFRYALLALFAYVMIARLRLHPWGLLAGASSVVAGVSVEALRLLILSPASFRKKS